MSYLVLLRRKPMLVFLLPFIVGIIISRFIPVIQYHWLVIAISAVIVFLLASNRFLTYNNSYIFGLFANFLFFLLGILLYTCHENQLAKKQIDEGVYIYLVKDIPVEKDNSVQVLLKTCYESTETGLSPVKAVVVSYFHKDSNSLVLCPGQTLLCRLKPRNIRNKGNPCEFDYQFYMKMKGIIQSAWLDSDNWRPVSVSVGFSPAVYSQEIRYWVLNKLRKIRDDDLYSLATAMIAGYREDLSEETRSAFVSSGAMHVLAVSGLHVGILYLFISTVLFFLKRIKYGQLVRLVIVLFILWGFALISGLSASVFRAVVLFSFIAVGRALNREVDLYNVLAASAIVLLLSNPLLLFNLGFQLSFLAVGSIVFFYPYINGVFVFRNRLLRWVWNLTSVSIAAQIGVVPLILYHFHQFPSYFLLSNLVVIPLAFCIVIGGILYLSTSFFPPFSEMIMWVLEKVLLSLHYSVTFIEKLPGSVIEGIVISWPQLIILLTTILMMVLFLIQKYRLFVHGIFVAAIVFIGSNCFIDAFFTKQNRLYIYNVEKELTIHLIQGKKNTLFSEHYTGYDRKNQLMFIEKMKLKQRMAEPECLCLNKNNTYRGFGYSVVPVMDSSFLFRFMNKYFFILNDDCRHWTSDTKLQADYLVINRNRYGTLQAIEQLFDIKHIIISPMLYKSKQDIVREQLNTNNIQHTVITETGPFFIDN
jgi:competence protein ComEC